MGEEGLTQGQAYDIEIEGAVWIGAALSALLLV